MGTERELRPIRPGEARVDEKTPELGNIESARVLADDAKRRLRKQGFSDDQIERWAETYIEAEGSGDVDHFVKWIAARENR